MTALQKRAKAAGLTNFNFYKSIPTETGGHKDSNWSRASAIFDGGDGGLRWPGVGDSDGSVSSVQPDSETPTSATSTTDTKPPVVEAKERAVAYKEMNKEQMNAEYDKLRNSDPAKAREEGMKMHKAFFGKV